MIANICYNSTEPNIGLKLNMDRMTLKCYMGDTGLLISHAFDENGLVSEEIYKKLLFDKLEVNKGMIMKTSWRRCLPPAVTSCIFTLIRRGTIKMPGWKSTS